MMVFPVIYPVMYAWQRLTSSGEEGRMTRLQSSRKSALLRPPGHKFLPAAPRNGYNGHVTVKNARVFVFCTGGQGPQIGRGGVPLTERSISLRPGGGRMCV